MSYQKTYFQPGGLTFPSLLNYLRNHDRFILLNNTFSDCNDDQPFDILVGVCGANNLMTTQLKDVDALLFKAKQNQQYVFGHLCYGLKDKIETLTSRHDDIFQWPLLRFFIPESVIKISGAELTIQSMSEQNCDDIFRNLTTLTSLPNKVDDFEKQFELLPAISKYAYEEKITEIKKHIRRGDMYEMNYCMEMKSENVFIDPFIVFNNVAVNSPAPFSCFYRDQNNYLISSSPERFIKRTGDKIISQPIKGTARRGTNSDNDKQFKESLFNSEKERAENVMIVDLVRNDLSRIAKRGTVKVEELFGIYSFPTVHQMISTVAAEVKAEINFIDIIHAMFPMGSMTGAPKISAMQYIDKFEDFNRGIYSGSLGYVAPNGDFDFNVVIRSIIYNSDKQYLSIPVGSAITDASDARAEYDECLLKAKGLLKSLGLQYVVNTVS